VFLQELLGLRQRQRAQVYLLAEHGVRLRERKTQQDAAEAAKW
jgi:hypothetical protein